MDRHWQLDEDHGIEDGSWVYLSLSGATGELEQLVADACRANGWPAVTAHAPEEGGHGGSASFFEAISHAVEHADVVIVSLDRSSSFVDAELAFACRYGRPVIAFATGAEEFDVTQVRSMLPAYERAFIVEAVDTDTRMDQLRRTFEDPAFGAIVQAAAGEPTTYG